MTHSDGTNVCNFYHGGDLGDTVYAIPALRRLAHKTHLTLYPNHGVTRALMDEENANRLLPLLNVQHNLTADWKPTYEPTGLRLDFAVRRFYKDGFNLADMHSHWVGHDHWHVDHPWMIVDRPEFDSPYKIVVARSARYRNDYFPWKELYHQFKGRACFIGVPWEWENFDSTIGKIPYVQTESFLEVARLMAAADVVICNQSCPRAIAEALKVPVVVEIGRPNNTHFGRDYSWYPAHCTETPGLMENDLKQAWIGSAVKKDLGFSPYKQSVLEEIARLCRLVRTIKGEIIEIGARRGGTTALISWALQRPLHLCDDFQNMEKEELEHLNNFLGVYDVTFQNVLNPDIPLDTKFVFAHITESSPSVLKTVNNWLLPRMAVGGIIVFNGASIRHVHEYVPKLGSPKPIDSITQVAGLYTFKIGG